ncbi:glycosyltransferase family 61 protein [archaeon]|nr:MAG: glycosyltransferase family 61 protein [archaeon]
MEMQNVVFLKGAVLVPHPTPERAQQQLTNELKSLYAAKEGHLPSALAQLSIGQYAFIAGPAFSYTSDVSHVCSAQDNNETVHFLFSWEERNAFHSLNDNLLPMLTQVYLQAITQTSRMEEFSNRVLYMFRGLYAHDTTSIYTLLHRIFPTVRPAKQIMQGGPHCVHRGVWGSNVKVFYRDSLLHLRYQLYWLLRGTLFRILRSLQPASKQQHTYSTPHAVLPGRNQTKQQAKQQAKHLSRQLKHRPKVVILTRNQHSEDSSAHRKLSVETEQKLTQLFIQHGADALICCDFAAQSTEVFLDLVLHVDICVGVHGAGLANCALASPGAVMIELQTNHNFGFDGFMKIAHMTGGHYLFVNVKRARQDAEGIHVPFEVLQDISLLSVRLWRYSVTEQVQGTIFNRTKPFGKDDDGDINDNAHSKKWPVYDVEKDRDTILRKTYKDDIILDLQHEIVYVHKDAVQNQSHFVQTTLGYGSFTPKDRETYNPKLGGQNQREYWIFLNPYLHLNEDVSETAMGPLLKDSYAHCIRLPYFKVTHPYFKLAYVNCSNLIPSCMYISSFG